MTTLRMVLTALVINFFSILTAFLPSPALAAVPATLAGPESRLGPDAQVTLGAYRGIVEEHVEGIVRTLHVIANTREARSGSWDEIKPLLARYSRELPTDAAAWFAQPDGNYFTTETSDTAEHSLKDRPYFSNLISGKDVFGDLVISKSTGHRSVIIATPVFAESTPTGGIGKVLGGIGVSLRVRLLSELVDTHMKLPEQAYFYALERDTRIALHRKADRMFKTPSDVGDEALGEQFKKELRHDKGTFEYTLNGKKIEALYELSPELGWYFFLAKEVAG